MCTFLDSTIKEQCIKIGYSEDKIYTPDILPLNYTDTNYFILAWWPYIVKEYLFNIPKVETLNFHTSLLPYNRGKHPTFWNIIEEVPYGVTIHFVDKSIDSGDIAFQREMEKDWIETSFSLYQKALTAIVQIFIDNYENIKSGNYTRKNQSNYGTFHYSKEFKTKLELKIDETIKIKELLDLLRAKDFPDSSQCYFVDNKNRYTVNVCITKDLKHDRNYI